MAPKARLQRILAAAVDLAVVNGYQNITRHEVAMAAGCAPGLVNVYFDTMESLREAIMREAIRREVLPVVAQGLSVGDPGAAAAPRYIRHRAAQWLASGVGR